MPSPSADSDSTFTLPPYPTRPSRYRDQKPLSDSRTMFVPRSVKTSLLASEALNVFLAMP